MSANINLIRLISEGWHGRAFDLGNGFIEEGELVTEAFQLAGMDVLKVLKLEAGRRNINGEWVAKGNQYDLVLDYLGEEIDLGRTVGNRYTPLQNDRFAEILNPLCEKYQLVGVGQINGWTTTFIQFALDAFDVGGHPNECYEQSLLFSDNKRTGSAYAQNTSTRVVCSNTFAMATSKMTKLPHADDIEEMMRYMVDVELRALEVAEYEREVLNRMFKTPMRDVNKTIERIFPHTRKSNKLMLYERNEGFQAENWSGEILNLKHQTKIEKELDVYNQNRERTEARRHALADRFQRFNDNYENGGQGTVYAFFNAVTDLMNHGGMNPVNGRPLFNGDEGEALTSVLWGERAKVQQRAWKQLEGMVK